MTDLPSHVSYARVVTPATTYHAFTLQHVDRNVMVHAHGETFTLTDAEVTGTVAGDWRCAGTNSLGDAEIWLVRKLSCGCNRHIGNTRPEEIPT